MSVDDVIKRATIQLRIPLDSKRTEKLLLYIAKELPVDITYVFSQHRGFLHTSNQVLSDLGTLKIFGSISCINHRTAFDSFETIPAHDTTLTSALRFFAIPGYELYEYPTERVCLWDDVRRIVENYSSSISSRQK
jgi:hypothetical protein